MIFYSVAAIVVIALFLYDHFHIDPKWLVYAMTMVVALGFAFLLNAFAKSRDDED